MTLIVGGNARNVGKTTLVCELILATRKRQWVAVKISGHPHRESPLPVLAGQPRATELFLAAGAAEAHLLRENEADRATLALLCASLCSSGRNVIIESNRAAGWVRCDHYLFILDEGAQNPKPRERWLLDRASWVLPPRSKASHALLAVIQLT